MRRRSAGLVALGALVLVILVTAVLWVVLRAPTEEIGGGRGGDAHRADGEPAARTEAMDDDSGPAPAGVLVHGRVTGPDGPIEGATVDPHGTPSAGLPEAVRTDAEGQYALRAPPRRRFILLVDAPGFYRDGLPRALQRRRARSNADEHASWWVETPAEGVVVHDVALDPGLTLRGQVVDPEGEPIAGARVFALYRDDTPAVTTGADGSFAFYGLPPPRHPLPLLVVRAEAPGWITRHGVHRRITEGYTDERARITMVPAAVVRGRVVDRTGSPIPGASACVSMSYEGRSEWVEVDTEGRFEMSIPNAIGPPGEPAMVGEKCGLEAGAHRLTLADAMRLRRGAAVPAGSTDVDLVAVWGATIEGVVVDEAGRPIETALVSAHRWTTEDGERRRVFAGRATTDENGRLRVPGLPHEATVHLTANARGRATATLEDVRPGGPSPRIVLRPSD